MKCFDFPITQSSFEFPIFINFMFGNYFLGGRQALPIWCISWSEQCMHLFEANRNFPCQCGPEKRMLSYLIYLRSQIWYLIYLIWYLIDFTYLSSYNRAMHIYMYLFEAKFSMSMRDRGGEWYLSSYIAEANHNSYRGPRAYFVLCIFCILYFVFCILHIIYCGSKP